MQCVADDDLVVGDQGALLEQRLQSGEPYLVVAHRQIFSRWAVLAYEARHVDIPAAWGAHGQRQREGALLPVGVEHRPAPRRKAPRRKLSQLRGPSLPAEPVRVDDDSHGIGYRDRKSTRLNSSHANIS